MVALSLSTMQPEDLAAVLDVERLSYANPWSAESFLQELRLPFSRVILARVDGNCRQEPVGHLCRWLTGSELHILNVAVHPEWRRRSVGRRLVEEALGEARRAAAVRGTLEVRRSNVPAVRLYENLGFSTLGLRRGYYGPGEDALVMEIRLVA